MVADALHDGQAEPGAARDALGAEETLEYARQILRGDAAPGIGHREPLRRVGHLDEAALGVVDGVADQVGQHEAQRLVVEIEHVVAPDLDLHGEALARNLGPYGSTASSTQSARTTGSSPPGS